MKNHLLSVILAATVSYSALAQQPNEQDRIWAESVSACTPQRTALLQDADRAAGEGPFQPNWDSLRQFQVPEWFRDAKFGIFIHWGVYSVPAYSSEWYPRKMYQKGSDEYSHQVAAYGPETAFGYKDFIPRFRAERFDPRAWARLFKESGARYVIPVAEHHDGFEMYGSKLSHWNAAEMGPHRDVLGELASAIRAEGLHFGASSHRAEHYWFMNGGREFASDVDDPKYASFYGPAHSGIDPHKDGTGHPDPAYLDDWLARSTEIVEKYHPELVYFDWWVEQKEFQPYLERFAAFYYNQAKQRGEQPVLFRKNLAFPDGTTVLDIERGQLDQIRPVAWQTDTSVSQKSWGYIEGDTYKSPQVIVWQLVDIVSKNGNLLLNVGPKSDGTIPEQASGILRQTGEWLKVNGEAIYGTRPWRVFGEGPTHILAGSGHDKSVAGFTPQDFRFTSRGATLYAISLAWPTDARLLIKSLGGASGFRVGDVSLLGSAERLAWKQDSDGLHIEVPAQAPGKFAYAFRVSPAAK